MLDHIIPEVGEDRSALRITFGSSTKISDGIVDTLAVWWQALEEPTQATVNLLQIKMQNGSESSGVRTQLLHRMVQLADHIGQPIQWLYYPPDYSKYKPIERCWGILELPWNGTNRTYIQTMRAWAKGMTWQGIHPVVELSRKVYQKGIALSKKAMQAVKAHLERHPELPKWAMLIRPALTA